jgi:hypothetical protein
LSESVSAVFKSAFVGPVTGVDSQMVKEVVPFAKHLAAVFVSAAEESGDSTCLLTLVLVDHEVLSARDMDLDSDLVQVKVGATIDIDDVVVVNDLSLYELGVNVEVELLFDLSLG